MSEPYRISIRELVPSPDLGVNSLANPERSHAAAQAVLRRKFKSFQSEISLRVEIELGDELFKVHGRLDGLRRVKGGFCIYEIKPVPGDAKQWRKHYQLQRARLQLLLYCDLFRLSDYAKKGELRKAVLYLAGDNGSFYEEAVGIDQSASALRRRLLSIRRDQLAKQSSIKTLERIENCFRIDMQSDRPLQADVESTLDSYPPTDRLLLTLPPGAGKTRIALRFALRSAKILEQQILWITAKSSGRHAILEEINRLRESGLDITSCWKTTAERLCYCELQDETCPVRLHTQTALFFGDISESALTNPDEALCTHQINRHIQDQVNVVIADMNYLLNNSNLNQKPAVLVIDEVQHFVDRIVESARITIPRRELKTLLGKLPASRRKKYSELLNPEWLDDELLSSSTSLWTTLADEIQLLQVDDNLSDSVTRLASILHHHKDSYHLTWYSGNMNAGWIGMIADPESMVETAIQSFPIVTALSGSLPEDTDSLRAMLPGFTNFTHISPLHSRYQTIVIIPELDSRFPVSSSDIEKSVSALKQLHSEYGATIAAFTQNRESSVLIHEALRVRGFVSILDQDIDPEWSIIQDLAPDFALIPLGSSLSESVNPPAGIFSCAAVLAPGHRPQDKLLLNSTNLSFSNGFYRQSVRESVSRIIQAVGRVQRSPDSSTPVFLLNRAFIQPEFMNLWPRAWRNDTSDFIFETLLEAIDHIRLSFSESSSHQ